ncbi:carboxypeptidase-like regulatory domain-containing protein [Cochleicola gelatinilyticus]|nr:carboxypeptidase-like regulatory domain-containing protein [Cochleicola gelatinilyticus]
MFNNYSYGQNEIRGKVFSLQDSIPLFGASVYFDGTNIGVSTDDDGSFKIPFTQNNSSLIVSAIGYESVVIDTQNEISVRTIHVLYLQEKTESLDAVHLETDPWSRTKKLGIFRREFIGKNKASLACKIINEDALRLRYIPSSKVLVANSTEPLIIKNKHLGYKINYTLTDFEVKFENSTMGLTLPYYTYYQGYSYFEELRNRVSKRTKKNRENSFLGSTLHFMRSLYKKTLDEDGYKVFYDSFQVPTYRYFKTTHQESLMEIEVLTDEIDILYNDFEQSGLLFEKKFYIDAYGNHTPANALNISGEMSKKRISNLMPVNYKIYENE